MKTGILLAGILAAVSALSAELEIPIPPQQKAPWVRPKVDLPEKLFIAAETLFKQGLADPRGLEYREVEVGAGSVWGGSSLVKTHGWVMSEKAGEKQRFAVTWNGLVYPVSSVGAECDLKADVEQMVKGELTRIEAEKTRNPRHTFHRYTDSPTPENKSVSHSFLQADATAMLLRLGEGELARKIWDVWMVGMPEQRNRNGGVIDDPYAQLALDWAWALFDRASCAHVRGDDPLALASVRMLLSLRAGIESECESRGYFSDTDDKRRFLSHLREIDKFAADQERRAKSQKGENELESILAVKPERETRRDAREELKSKIKEKWPDTEKRVRMLIENLDIIAGSPFDRGVIYFDENPVYATLVAEGRDAVEPLIECVEKDTRLTRSVNDDRRYRTHYIVPVNQVAYEALQSILKTRNFGGIYSYQVNENGGTRAAAAVREYWNSIKDVSIEESWYLGLANDSFEGAKWVQFARNITGLAEGKRTMRGEMLRAKKDPSVTELLIKRTKICCAPNALNEARDLARALYRWEPARSAETLREFCDAVKPQLDANRSSGWAATASEFVSMRLALGDETALQEYAASLPRVSPPEFGNPDSLQTWFKPIWQHPEDPAITAAAEKLFSDPASPWSHMFDSSQRFINKRSLLKSWLLGVEPFRKLVLRALADHSDMGTATIRENGYAVIEGKGAGTSLVWKDDPLAPPVGTKVSFRLCDIVGHTLGEVDGISRCEVYWPEKERDAALARIIEFFQKHSELLRWRAKLPPAGMTDRQGMKALPNLVKLDHPATREDVEKQRAIFSLEGEGERRVAELPVPVKARWLKCPNPVKRDPEIQVYIKPTDEGYVWQAEEVFKDGKWQRVVGYIGAHEILRLLADEVEIIGVAK